MPNYLRLKGRQALGTSAQSPILNVCLFANIGVWIVDEMNTNARLF